MMRIALFAILILTTESTAKPIRVATFSVEVTCPIGHPLIAGLRQPAKKIVDPLWARGLVLLGEGKPIVLCAIDWCEIRNSAYERWREALAKAAGTEKARVLFTCLHQHDAPVSDLRAEELLKSVGLGGAMFEVKFHERCIQRVANGVKRCLKKTQPVTHVGIGQAKIEKLASNRRVVLGKRVVYSRGSGSGGNKAFREAPDGLIDPWLKTISLWNGDQAIVAISSYAIHPMSYYGRGGVSADFVGMARDQRQREDASIFQIYLTGCSGDTTAGKYNDASPANRPVLAKRLYDGMKSACKATKKHAIEKMSFRSVKLDLKFREVPRLSKANLEKTLKNVKAPKGRRVLAAMGLASRERVKSGLPIDFPCVDCGKAKLILFPGETWVGYQLDAQKQTKDFLMCVGFGECWPGYIPTTQGFEDKFEDIWYWVGRDADRKIPQAVKKVLQTK